MGVVRALMPIRMICAIAAHLVAGCHGAETATDIASWMSVEYELGRVASCLAGVAFGENRGDDRRTEMAPPAEFSSPVSSRGNSDSARPGSEPAAGGIMRW